MTDALAIDARHLTKRFGPLVAVDDVDLAVRYGELFGLLGPNGAGKTTLLRMLIGLVPITAGEARIAGVDVRTDPDRVRNALGVVPQALTSDLDLTGYENMDIYARYFGVDRRSRAVRIAELLHRTGLWDRRNDLVRTYSGGMRRRLEIARGLIHKPRVLVLDEPTIGLDPQSRHVIWDLLRDLRKDGDLTVVLTTHYLDEADALCDRVAIIDRGKIVELGTPAELKAKVPGSDTVTLSLARPPPDDVIDRVRTLGGVRELVRTNHTLTIRADRGTELLPKLLDTLRDSGALVTSASLSTLTLEDAFIHFTGQSLREEAPNHAPVHPRRFT